ncbi:hypothetical protein ES708_10037 [subsurface metagenome]
MSTFRRNRFNSFDNVRIKPLSAFRIYSWNRNGLSCEKEVIGGNLAVLYGGYSIELGGHVVFGVGKGEQSV